MKRLLLAGLVAVTPFAFVTSHSTDVVAQSRHMDQGYNPHKRKLNRGHDKKNKEKTWKEKRSSNDPGRVGSTVARGVGS